jgi:hypothetical protein
MEFVLPGLIIIGLFTLWKRASHPATSEYYQKEDTE